MLPEEPVGLVEREREKERKREREKERKGQAAQTS
jgi:hypothetical protein